MAKGYQIVLNHRPRHTTQWQSFWSDEGWLRRYVGNNTRCVRRHTMLPLRRLQGRRWQFPQNTWCLTSAVRQPLRSRVSPTASKTAGHPGGLWGIPRRTLIWGNIQSASARVSDLSFKKNNSQSWCRYSCPRLSLIPMKMPNHKKNNYAA